MFMWCLWKVSKNSLAAGKEGNDKKNSVIYVLVVKEWKDCFKAFQCELIWAVQHGMELSNQDINRTCSNQVD